MEYAGGNVCFSFTTLFFPQDSYIRVHHLNSSSSITDGGESGGGRKGKKRMETRAVYRQFVDEFLPSWQNVGRKRVLREDVREIVLDRWGKRREYEEKMERWRRYMEEKPVKEEIREAGIVMEMRWADAWVRSQAGDGKDRQDLRR